MGAIETGASLIATGKPGLGLAADAIDERPALRRDPGRGLIGFGTHRGREQAFRPQKT
jgi:hypothetical protein